VNLYQQIQSDIKETFKNNQLERREVLRYLYSLLQNEEVKLGDKFNDKSALAVLHKEMKRKKESLEMFEKAERENLVKNQKMEISILQEYLPKMMTEQELEEIVKRITIGEGNPSFGVIMGKVMQEVKGRADGKIVLQVVQRMVS